MVRTPKGPIKAYPQKPASEVGQARFGGLVDGPKPGVVSVGKRDHCGIYPLPEQGKRFKPESLGPNLSVLYNRVSDVWGIPVQELLPFRAKLLAKPMNLKGKLTDGVYSPVTHTLDAIRDYGSLSEEALEHELAHAALQPISPHVFRLNQTGSLGLHTVTDHRTKSLRRLFKVMVAGQMALFAYKRRAAAHEGMADTQPLMPKVRYPAIHELAKRHGPDAVILLAVDGFKGTSRRSIEKAEQGYLRDGLLYSRSESDQGTYGFTPRGIMHVRNLMPQRKILRNLRYMEENRNRLLTKDGKIK